VKTNNEREKMSMKKIIAIIAVIAVMPAASLAGQVSSKSSEGKFCSHRTKKVSSVFKADAPVAKSDTAVKAN
jgi:flagellar basal body-associated protein FliL